MKLPTPSWQVPLTVVAHEETAFWSLPAHSTPLLMSCQPWAAWQASPGVAPLLVPIATSCLLPAMRSAAREAIPMTRRRVPFQAKPISFPSGDQRTDVAVAGHRADCASDEAIVPAEAARQ